MFTFDTVFLITSFKCYFREPMKSRIFINDYLSFGVEGLRVFFFFSRTSIFTKNWDGELAG